MRLQHVAQQIGGTLTRPTRASSVEAWRSDIRILCPQYLYGIDIFYGI